MSLPMPPTIYRFLGTFSLEGPVEVRKNFVRSAPKDVGLHIKIGLKSAPGKGFILFLAALT